MLPLNVNQSIKVKLTTYGDLALQQTSFGSIAKKDEDGFYEFQLWRFIQIFGDHFYLGAHPVIEGGLIYIDEKEFEDQ